MADEDDLMMDYSIISDFNVEEVPAHRLGTTLESSAASIEQVASPSNDLACHLTE